MAKEVQKPKEELAPAYFTLYSALWCIMLGFFVMLLSLGSTQMGPGADGVGQVRDAFGNNGGLGLLPFAKNVLFGRNDGSASSFRIRKSAPQQVKEMDGYIRGMLWKKGLSDVSMISVLKDSDESKVILQIPLHFRTDEHLSQDSVRMVEMLGEVFLNLKGYDFEVMSVGELGADAETRRRKAMTRSAVIVRLLLDTSALSPEHVHAVGFSNSDIINSYGINHVKGNILISVRKGK